MRAFLIRLKGMSASGFLAYGTMGVGAAWTIYMTYVSVVEFYPVSNESLSIISFILGILTGIIVTAPGVFCVYFGYRLSKKATADTVIGTLGLITILTAVLLLGFIGEILDQFLPGRLAVATVFLLTTAILIPPYMFTCDWMLRREQVAFNGYRDILGKPVLFIIAIEIWMFASAAIEQFPQRPDEFEPGDASLWIFVTVAVPLLLALAFFFTTSRALGHHKPHAKPLLGPTTLPRT